MALNSERDPKLVGDNEESAAKLAAVLNTVSDGIITINRQGIIQSFNLSAEHIFGYSPNEVIGENVNILMPSPYQQEHDDYLANYLSTGDAKVIGKGREVKAKRKDGSIFPMELGVNQMDISGEIMFVGTIRDISDKKYVEVALQDSQATLEAIVEHTVDGLITINETGQIETFNKACEVIFGYPAKDVIGQNVKILMPAPYQAEHDGYLNNYHTTGIKKIIGIGREVEGLRKNGERFPLDLSVSQVKVLGRTLYSGIVRDISTRKKAEDEILQANAELAEFAYRTSHDLRSPLVSSIKLLDLVQDAIHQDDKASALASTELIQTSLQKLERLIKDILSLTKVQHSSEDKQNIDLDALFQSVEEKIRHMSNFQRLHINYNVKFKGKLLVQKSELTLIVENLLSNAVKYQDLKKANAYVHISTSKRQNTFVLQVCDNGLGIPKNQQENIFKMFKRFHPRTSYGSGLGLYMIKKSAEKMQGQIHFEAKPDETCFTLTVPLSDDN